MEVSLSKTNFIAPFKKPLQWGGGNYIQMRLYRSTKQRLSRKNSQSIEKYGETKSLKPHRQFSRRVRDFILLRQSKILRMEDQQKNKSTLEQN